MAAIGEVEDRGVTGAGRVLAVPGRSGSGSGMEPLSAGNLCRTCCESVSAGDSLPLFRVNLHRKVMACVRVRVWRNDGLPDRICKWCAAKLHQTYKFKTLAERSDVRLRRLRDRGALIPLRPASPEESPAPAKVPSPAPSPSPSPSPLPSPIPSPLRSPSPEDYPIPSPVRSPVHSPIEPPTPLDPDPACSLDSIDAFEEFELPRRGLRSPDLESIRRMIAAHADPDAADDSAGDVSPIHLPEGFVESVSLDGSADSADAASVDLSRVCVEPLPPVTPPPPTPEPPSPPPPPSPTLPPPSPPPSSPTLPPPSPPPTPAPPPPKPKPGPPPPPPPPPPPARRFRCPVCDAEFATRGAVDRHSETHSVTPPHACDVCGKRFAHAGNLRAHVLTHTDERPFACALCPTRFRRRQDLQRHVRTHTGERPHACLECGRAFASSSNLAAHLRIHLGERPYVCPVCRKAFCQSNELSKHLRVHTGERNRGPARSRRRPKGNSNAESESSK